MADGVFFVDAVDKVYVAHLFDVVGVRFVDSD